MATIKSCYINILETGTVALSVGTEHSSYPLYRLFDRDIGKIFKTTAAATMEVKIDQGGTNYAVDQLFIPAGHNLNGMTLDIWYSDNDSAWSPAVAQWVQSGNTLIRKAWTTETRRYWKFIITNPASIPQIPEMFLTSTYTWERNPSRPTGNFLNRLNVERLETSGGNARYLAHGSPRKYRNYPQVKAKSGQKDNVRLMYDTWQGSKPFWLCDHEGNWIYGEILNMEMSEQASDMFLFNFEFLEVLP